jgi:hypothetical protein
MTTVQAAAARTASCQIEEPVAAWFRETGLRG